MVFSHQTRDLERVASNSDIPSNPPTILYPDRTAIAPQMSLLPLCALPFVSDPCGFDVPWFQDNSSQSMPNSKELAVRMTFGFLVGSRNFIRFFWIVFHGYDCIHCVAKSGTTTAYLVPLRYIGDSSAIHFLHSEHWSAVIKSSKFSALGMTASPRLLQEALLIFVFKQISRFRSFGKCVKTLLTRTRYHFCSRLHLKFMRRLGSILTSLLWVSPKLCWSTFIDQICLNSCSPIRQLIQKICILLLIHHFSVIGFCGFIQRVFPKLFTRTPTSFWSWIFGVSVVIKFGILWWRWWRSRWRWSWGKNSLIDHEPHMVHSWIHCSRFSCHFWWDVVFDCWSSGMKTHDPHRVSRVKELKEAQLSRISPILWHVLSLFLLFAPRRYPSSPSSDSSMSPWSPIQQSYGLACKMGRSMRGWSAFVFRSRYRRLSWRCPSSGLVVCALSVSTCRVRFRDTQRACLGVHR